MNEESIVPTLQRGNDKTLLLNAIIDCITSYILQIYGAIYLTVVFLIYYRQIERWSSRFV